jgi:8-oxo-dGTP diphosphatase
MEQEAATDRHEVVAGIVIRAGQVLLCHRSPERTWYPDVWDLPGGHIAANESPAGALGRELREELGIDATVPPGPEFARLAAADVDCLIWIVTDWVGPLSNMAPDEHDEVAWWSLLSLSGLRLAHQDYPSLIRRALEEHRPAVPFSGRPQLPGPIDLSKP